MRVISSEAALMKPQYFTGNGEKNPDIEHPDRIGKKPHRNYEEVEGSEH